MATENIDIKAFTVVKLREELDKRGLEKSGLKAELIKRLENEIQTDTKECENNEVTLPEECITTDELHQTERIDIEAENHDSDELASDTINERTETAMDDTINERTETAMDDTINEGTETAMDDQNNHNSDSEITRGEQEYKCNESDDINMKETARTNEFSNIDIGTHSNNMKRNLLVNNLPSTLCQSDVMEIFTHIGPVSDCQLARNKITGQSLGYAFIEYPDENLAASAITQINGIKMEGKKVKVTYAAPPSSEKNDTNLYISGLPQHITDDGLFSLFSKFGSILSHKVLKNPDRSSRGIGFVRYALNSEAVNAILAMAGKTLPHSDVFLTVKFASVKGNVSNKDSTPTVNDIKSNILVSGDSTTESNTNLYISGLPESVTEEELVILFSPYGSVLSPRILRNPDGTSRGVGFVRFSSYPECQRAITAMSGKPLPNCDVALTVKLAIPPAAKNHTTQSLNMITTNTLNNGIGVATRTLNVRYNPMAPSSGMLAQSMNSPFNQGINILTNQSTNPFLTPQQQNIASIYANMNANMNANKSLNSGVVPATSVYIYGLQPQHTELTLYELCAPFGPIVNVKLIRDLTKDDQPCKGYGFVNFAKNDDALIAVSSLNGVVFEQKTLQVSFKQSKNQNTQSNSHPGIISSVSRTMSNLVNVGLIASHIK